MAWNYFSTSIRERAWDEIAESGVQPTEQIVQRWWMDWDEKKRGVIGIEENVK